MESTPSVNSFGICTTLERETPAPFRLASSEVRAKDPKVIPWKAPIKDQMVDLFFTLRASFKAASTAFVPVGPTNCTL